MLRAGEGGGGGGFFWLFCLGVEGLKGFWGFGLGLWEPVQSRQELTRCKEHMYMPAICIKYIYICIYIYMFTCVHIYIYIHVYIYIYIYMNIYQPPTLNPTQPLTA